MAQTNPPPALRLTAKVRDFAELPNAANPCSGANCPNHPDFNTYLGDCRGSVDALIDTTGSVNPAVFPFDNRNPKLLGARSGCFTGTSYFNDWFNDRISNALPDQNKPFLYDLSFTRNAQGMYVYDNPFFFPLDDDSITRGVTRPIPGGPTKTFGHLNTGSDTRLHNYGFTTEFHATFSYIAADATHPAQVFDFTGDDDVWVFINNKLVIDLGGVHSAESQSVTLDAATAANLGLQNGQSYMLDFFLAERHVVASDAKITTSLVLDQRVDKPKANPPGGAFTSQVAVGLSTNTPGTTIYYTTDGSTPDSTDTKYDPLKPILITGNTTLKAIAYKPGWTTSDVMTETYTKTFTASTLQILDQNGNALPGYLSELNTAYTIKLTTTQAGLTSVTPNASTAIALDKEKVTITTSSTQGDFITWTGAEPFSIGAATSGNGKSEASTYDTLIVRWVNPLDSTRDVVEKRVWVRPAPKQARIYFATNADGTGATDTIAGTATQIYVFVVDEVLPAAEQPTVTLTTTAGPAHPGNNETETLNLTVVSPGLYRAAVPLQAAPVPVVNDKKLQVQIGDLIRAKYIDPLDKDSISTNAGFGIQPEIEGTLTFTDKAGVPIPDGTYYDPSSDSLYLSYQDDFILGLNSIPATLSIVNRTGTADPDLETVQLAFAQQVGSAGVWKGAIKLAAGPHIVKNNDTAETYVLGVAHAEVTSHKKTDTKDLATGPKATDSLLVAYPNQDPTIIITGADGTDVVKRVDGSVNVTIKDQSLSPAVDTIYFNVQCTGSRDAIVDYMAIETSPGVYVSKPIPKGEGGAVPNDGKLECLSHDVIRVTYQDPVYGDSKSAEKDINEPVAPKLYFSSDAEGKNPITRVSDADADSFYVVVVERNADINAVDKDTVTIAIGGGETETFEVVETGKATNTYVAKVPFKFVTGAPAANGILEGKISSNNLLGVVTAIGTVMADGGTATGSIDLAAAYDKVQKAYIKDTDGDGRGDKVYITFVNQLSHVPSSVIAHWNSDADADAKTADKAKISFLNSDSTTLVLDFTGNQFAKDSTAASATNPPTAVLPADDALFKGQKQVIEDSIGPVIVKAVKHPVNPNLVGKGDPTLNKDTLYVTLSEPLKNIDPQFLKYSTSGCTDYASAKTVTILEQPSTVPGDKSTYVVIVDNTGYAPSVGNCVFLNAEGKYTDNNNNIPPKYGVPVTGDNGPRLIELFRGYPPVAGLSPLKSPAAFSASNQDSHDETKNGYATETSPGSGKYAVYWIPPVGFNPGSPTQFDGSIVNGRKVNIDDMPSGTDAGTFTDLPDNISTVEVVSTQPYIAHIFIYDNLGNFLRSMVQTFGFGGELNNKDRNVRGGHLSFLVWDRLDNHGQLAGNGVYVWKVTFQFQGGKQDVEYTRTGILRNK